MNDSHLMAQSYDSRNVQLFAFELAILKSRQTILCPVHKFRVLIWQPLSAQIFFRANTLAVKMPEDIEFMCLLAFSLLYCLPLPTFKVVLNPTRRKVYVMRVNVDLQLKDRV